MNLIEEYEKWMETGELPKPGLCNCLSGTQYESTLDFFLPSYEELCELVKKDISNFFGVLV